MKKCFRYFIIFIITLLISFGCFLSKPVIADSGWDASYGGSSSSSSHSGSSSYSSSHGSSYSSSGDGEFGETEAMIIIIYIIIVSTIMLVNYVYNHVIKEKEIDEEIQDLFNIEEFSGFNTEKLQIELFNVYKKIQLAWAKNDIEPVRDILTDELFNNYKMQIETMLSLNQRNVMKDIVFNNMNVIDVTRKNNIEEMKVVMEVTCKDYVVETIDGIEEVIQGNEYSNMNYYYEMTFVRHIKKHIKKCPNCGNKLKGGLSIKCDYCGGVVILETDHFVLAKKKMLKQMEE